MPTDHDRERLHAEIDSNLRRAYQQNLNEELPKRFVDLIDKLRSGQGIETSETDQKQAPDQ